MSQRIAGLEPAELGWGRYRVAPQLSGLDSVEAWAPTPAGELRVRWRRDGDAVVGEIEAPEGLAGELVVPEGRRVVIGGTALAEAAAYPIGGGTTTLRIE